MDSPVSPQLQSNPNPLPSCVHFNIMFGIIFVFLNQNIFLPIILCCKSLSLTIILTVIIVVLHVHHCAHVAAVQKHYITSHGFIASDMMFSFTLWQINIDSFSLCQAFYSPTSISLFTFL